MLKSQKYEKFSVHFKSRWQSPFNFSGYFQIVLRTTIWWRKCLKADVATELPLITSRIRIKQFPSIASQFQRLFLQKCHQPLLGRYSKTIETNRKKKYSCGTKNSGDHPVLGRTIRVNAVLTCAHLPQHHEWELVERTTGVHRLSILVIDVYKYKNTHSRTKTEIPLPGTPAATIFLISSMSSDIHIHHTMKPGYLSFK